MGLGKWLKTLFAPKRDISRLAPLAAARGSDDAVQEVVDTSGGPLKEGHHRRALRDKRLLPKSKPMGRRLGLTKRKRIMSAEEGQRLFGGTMRTRNRKLRDLLPDAEQLKRYGLPVWKSEEDVAQALDISVKELWYFSIHREREAQPHYVTFAIPKRTGGKRLIMAPKRRLKAIQRKLLALLVEKLPVSERAHAFRRGRNVRTAAEPHVGKCIVMRLDLKDFFPSVTFARVRGLLIAYGYSFPVANTLAVLMTEAERQPVALGEKVYHVPVGNRHCVQGAPTSPGLCNAIVLRLDRRLAALAQKRGFVYTRYADDLTFSGDAERVAANQLRHVASKIITQEGFTVNQGKTRLMGRGTRQSVTGLVVNQTLGLSRRVRRRFRAMAHRLAQKAKARQASAEELAIFTGHLAYLNMLNPAQAAKVRDHFARKGNS